MRATVAEIRSRIDVEHLAEREADQLALNDIGEVVIETSRAILADLYRENRTTGSFILIDPADNATAGAGMIRALRRRVGNLDVQRCPPTGLFSKLARGQLWPRSWSRRLLGERQLVLRTRVRACSRPACSGALGRDCAG